MTASSYDNDLVVSFSIEIPENSSVSHLEKFLSASQLTTGDDVNISNYQICENIFYILIHISCNIKRIFNKLADGQFWLLRHYSHSPVSAGYHRTSSDHLSGPVPSCEDPAGRRSYTT